MATETGSITVNISQSISDGATIFGLPGYGTGNPTLCNVNLTVTVHCWDDATATMDIAGSITHPDLLSETYDVALYICPHDWDWTWSSSGPNTPSGGFQVATGQVIVGSGVSGGRGSFTWNINVSGVYIGNIANYGASSTGDDGICWFSGTGTYNVTDPIYPDPMPITIPGFLAYLDYFPWASYENEWASCNRSGGYVQSYSGEWIDKKNTQSGDASTVHYYSDGWVVCPEIGAT